MDEDAIFTRLDYLLDLHFPDDPKATGPSWNQNVYQKDLFDLCIQAYGKVRRDDAAEYARTHWNIRRQHQLPEERERQLGELFDAWGNWQYAYQQLVAENNTQVNPE